MKSSKIKSGGGGGRSKSIMLEGGGGGMSKSKSGSCVTAIMGFGFDLGGLGAVPGFA